MRSQIARVSTFGFGLVMMVAAMGGQALAGTAVPAPEIDGSFLSAGLAGLTAGLLILRSRRRSK